MAGSPSARLAQASTSKGWIISSHPRRWPESAQHRRHGNRGPGRAPTGISGCRRCRCCGPADRRQRSATLAQPLPQREAGQRQRQPRHEAEPGHGDEGSPGLCLVQRERPRGIPARLAADAGQDGDREQTLPPCPVTPPLNPSAGQLSSGHAGSGDVCASGSPRASPPPTRHPRCRRSPAPATSAVAGINSMASSLPDARTLVSFFSLIGFTSRSESRECSPRISPRKPCRPG